MQRIDRALKVRDTYTITEKVGYQVSNNDSNYFVIISDNTKTCTCPDYTYRRHPCKHILAVLIRNGDSQLHSIDILSDLEKDINTDNTPLSSTISIVNKRKGDPLEKEFAKKQKTRLVDDSQYDFENIEFSTVYRLRKEDKYYKVRLVKETAKMLKVQVPDVQKKPIQFRKNYLNHSLGTLEIIKDD